MLIESGDILELDELGARKAGRANVGRVCIDSGSRTDVVEDLIIKDRRHISEDGIVLPIIAINKLTGRAEGSPEIVTRGFNPGEDEFMTRCPAIGDPDPGAIERRGKGRLRSHQRKDSGGFEALYLQADAEAAADHAGHFGDLGCNPGHQHGRNPAGMLPCSREPGLPSSIAGRRTNAASPSSKPWIARRN